VITISLTLCVMAMAIGELCMLHKLVE
jgi:hypothetical protein